MEMKIVAYKENYLIIYVKCRKRLSVFHQI